MHLKEVKKDIGELKEQLKNVPAETSELETKLEHAHEGLHEYTPESVENLATFLKREAQELETEHPEVTELINRIMISLSNIGI